MPRPLTAVCAVEGTAPRPATDPPPGTAAAAAPYRAISSPAGIPISRTIRRPWCGVSHADVVAM